MRAREEFLSLTPKGLEALRGQTPKLDPNSRNILSLIQQGATSQEAILHRSKFPREVVLAALRLLLTQGVAEPRLELLKVQGGRPGPVELDSTGPGSSEFGTSPPLS